MQDKARTGSAHRSSCHPSHPAPLAGKRTPESCSVKDVDKHARLHRRHTCNRAKLATRRLASALRSAQGRQYERSQQPSSYRPLRTKLTTAIQENSIDGQGPLEPLRYSDIAYRMADATPCRTSLKTPPMLNASALPKNRTTAARIAAVPDQTDVPPVSLALTTSPPAPAFSNPPERD